MTEKVVTLQQIANTKLIFYVLMLAVVIYGLLIYILESAVGPSPDTSGGSGIELLPPVLAIVAIIEVVGIFKFFLPRVMNAEKYNDCFSFMLITSMMCESIGLYGALIGLLNLFIQGQMVQWTIVMGFLGLSLLIQFYLINNKYSPKLQSLLGTSYTPVTTS